jgi:adenylosuccinate synthase
MPVTVVVGGQFGSEGKGKVAHYFAREQSASAAVRVGGTNSGHTVITPAGDALILRQLPTAAILPEVYCVLPAGSYIDLEILFKEIEKTGLEKERLIVDPKAMIISPEDISRESTQGLKQSIGSTGSGTGAAVQRRISRAKDTRFAKDFKELNYFVHPTTPFMRRLLQAEKRIIIEGTQGFGLSLLHAKDYPYVTSRDTTAAGFVAEAGLSPLDVDEVVLVIRAFPIRVAGNSGPLPNEITWKDISNIAKRTIAEYSSVSKELRRVAKFDFDIVSRAMQVNNPTNLVLNHLDYLKQNEQARLVNSILELLNIEINFLGYGPGTLLPGLISKEGMKYA